ncbi:thiamine phosphate synthase [Clostridium sp. D2Q-11]|uniref:Thiamine-phosphate synthase n=1 Tax=Anaeromonas frigoriresistens TaxID=2683708 RepID=A0A942UW39_9FIRM|nr:thiamine phosphate synthase [Anaeromonas frigoriresistens]MBS4538600.1 thiamine phosphate synthase [Anaeromonas frigoriresistens]
MKIDYNLYLVIGESFLNNITLEHAVEQAILGGVSIIQLREKECNTIEYYKKAQMIKKVTEKDNIPLIINDRVDIALAIDADGVHLGQNDLPIKEARKLLGKSKIIGATVRSVEQAIKAIEEGADYLGIGATYPTKSKTDVSKVLGIKGVKEIASLVDIPKVAIGGINITNVEEVLTTGVNGVAVISGILKSKDIRKSAKEIKGKISSLK